MGVWKPLIIYLVIQSITPGPNNLTSLFLGGKYGLRGCSKFLSGSMTGLLIKTLICGFLNIVLSRIMPSIVVWMKWVGAAYMVYLAFCMVISGWKEENSEGSEEKQNTFSSGILLQVLNGKSWIAAIGMFSVYIIPITDKPSVIVIFAAVFILLCLIASIIWALCGLSLRNLISRYRKIFGIVMGVSLLWCAVSALI